MASIASSGSPQCTPFLPGVNQKDVNPWPWHTWNVLGVGSDLLRSFSAVSRANVQRTIGTLTQLMNEAAGATIDKTMDKYGTSSRGSLIRMPRRPFSPACRPGKDSGPRARRVKGHNKITKRVHGHRETRHSPQVVAIPLHRHFPTKYHLFLT
jgi:hypothetical protein